MSERDYSQEPRRNGARPFTVERLDSPDGVVLVALAGEADISSAPAFRAVVEEGLAEHADATLVLDLAEVGFMDSSMLKELLRLRAEAEARSGVIVLAAPQPAVRRLLELTRTSELFLIEETRQSALERATGAR